MIIESFPFINYPISSHLSKECKFSAFNLASYRIVFLNPCILLDILLPLILIDLLYILPTMWGPELYIPHHLKAVVSESVLIILPIFVSSANLLISLLIPISRSVKCIVNNSGPETDSWGIYVPHQLSDPPPFVTALCYAYHLTCAFILPNNFPSTHLTFF